MVEPMPLPNETVTSLAMALVESSKAPMLLLDDDVVVTQVTMSRPGGTTAVGGQMNLQARAKSDTAVRDLEERLRDGTHRVTPGRTQQDKTVPGYPRSIELHVDIVSPSDPQPEAAP